MIPVDYSSNPIRGMLEKQKSFLARWVGVDEIQKDENKLQHWALDQIGHAIEELGELRRQFPARKYWKKTQEPLDKAKILDEYADILHFIVNIGLVIGIRSPEEIWKIYNDKHEINLKRQETGY